jgi:hypothetical protein
VYGRGAQPPVAGAALQRERGAVYPSLYQQGSPLEHSGSLTGHILSHGHQDARPPKSRTVKVVVVLILVLVLLTAFGFLVATVARDTINDVLKGLLGGG